MPSHRCAGGFGRDRASRLRGGILAISSLNEYDTLKRVAARHVRDAFYGSDRIAREWRSLSYTDAIDFDRACAEYGAFLRLIEGSGTRVDLLPAGEGLGLDAIYVRDACLISAKGLIVCNMAKRQRAEEPRANAMMLKSLDQPFAGAIRGAGRIEGGDFVWIDEKSCVVGQGGRTNAEGIRQLREILGPHVHVHVVHLPRYTGPGQVFHLMSMISPLDRDLALIFSPLMPASFRRWLIDRGLTLIEVPDEEFESLGCNVLALAPRKGLMLRGNPTTRGRLEAAGCEVHVYEGREISIKGCGGPTCLTRPLARA